MTLGYARRNEEEDLGLPMTPTNWRRVKKGIDRSDSLRHAEQYTWKEWVTPMSEPHG
jgi:hypothetical protein